MTLTFEILGYTLARVKLDIERTEHPVETIVERGVDAMSGWWVDRMMKKRR